MPLDNGNWYTVITKPRQENVALDNLQRQDFHCFLPMAENPARRRKKSASGIEPLFPGYLFLRADPNAQSLAPVRSTRGALQMLRFGLKLAVVPERIIDTLKSRRCPETGLIKLSWNQPEPGDKVHILEGPMAGLSGVFQEKNKQTRAILLLNFLGKETRVEIDTQHLERA